MWEEILLRCWEFSNELLVASVDQCFTLRLPPTSIHPPPKNVVMHVFVVGTWERQRSQRTRWPAACVGDTAAGPWPQQMFLLGTFVNIYPACSGCNRPGRRTTECDADRAAGIGPRRQLVFSIIGLMLKRCRATLHIPTKDWIEEISQREFKSNQ